jgi:hypothetical protein
MAGQLSSERNTSETPHFSRGVLFGLPPFLVFVGSLVTMYLAGYCGNGLVLLLQEIAVALWGIELVVGIGCLFKTRLRSFAIGLILTLLVSVLLSWSLDRLSLWFPFSGPSFFCHFRN